VISGDEPGFAPDPLTIAPLIDIFAVADGNEVAVTGVTRLETKHIASGGRQTGYVAELIHGDTVIAADTVYAFDSDGCGSGGGCGCGGDRSDKISQRKQPLFLRAMIDDVALGDCLRILDLEGKVVWERPRLEAVPKVQRVRATLDKKTCSVRLSWTASVAKGAEPRASVRWSADGGQTWRALTAGLTDCDVTFDPGQLPGGKIRFQVLLDDGFSTATGETDEIELPARPPEVTILAPADRAELLSERQMHLLGVASAMDGRHPETEGIVWTIDGKEVGRGPDIWVDTPPAGRHKLELTASLDDQSASAGIGFEVH
jgi:hypothetical protein